jgi:hypothetical protein
MKFNADPNYRIQFRMSCGEPGDTRLELYERIDEIALNGRSLFSLIESLHESEWPPYLYADDPKLPVDKWDARWRHMARFPCSVVGDRERQGTVRQFDRSYLLDSIRREVSSECGTILYISPEEYAVYWENFYSMFQGRESSLPPCRNEHLQLPAVQFIDRLLDSGYIHPSILAQAGRPPKQPHLGSSR